MKRGFLSFRRGGVSDLESNADGKPTGLVNQPISEYLGRSPLGMLEHHYPSWPLLKNQ